MTDVYIGWWGLAASLVPLLVVVGISAARRLGLERDLVVATVRAVAQLVLAGWALTLLLDEGTSIIWAWAWVADITTPNASISVAALRNLDIVFPPIDFIIWFCLNRVIDLEVETEAQAYLPWGAIK